MRNDGFCLGDCPRYTLAIYGNGTVEYGGIDNVAVQGRRTAEISQERVRQLVEAFHEIDFFSFKDVY